MNLIVRDKNLNLATNVILANSFATRLFGLMGKKSLAENTCMWIKKTNFIHTHFMRFDIDVIFVDANMKVLKVKEAVKPWRFTLPVLGAESVFEFYSQNMSKKINEGDTLYVGD